MNITHSTVGMMLITDVPSLDPIRVVTEDYEPGKGRIIIACYSRAWVGYWGGMGNRTIKQFFASEHHDYLMGNLTYGIVEPRTKEGRTAETRYLQRLIQAVQQAFQSEIK